MKIAVCCKLTPDAEDVKTSADGSVDLSRANWNVSEYDRNAIVAAQDMGADEVVAITAGGTNVTNSRLTKTLMSHGNTSSLIRIADDAIPDMDSKQLAVVLAAAIRKSGADVALFGEGSSDRYQRIMGPQVAAELGWPCVNCADAISVDGSTITVDRETEEGIEVLEVQAPCVIAVTSTINVPPLPAMKAVLAAGKKPVEDVTLSDLAAEAAPAVERVSSSVPAMPGRQKVILEGAPDEVAAQLVQKLTADKIL